VSGVRAEVLSEAQLAAFGRFRGVPSREQLERYFLLDDAVARHDCGSGGVLVDDGLLGGVGGDEVGCI